MARAQLSLFRQSTVYLEALKPRETTLLTFIGLCAAIVAAGGSPPLGKFFLVLGALLLGSAGCNGLTNYLDREVDAKMERTRHRVLPSGRISPPEKVLPWGGGLVAVALALAWVLHPFAFLAGLLGTGAALAGRKMAITHLLGGIAGAAPVAVGYLALNPGVNPTFLLLLLLILFWVPLHVWTVMLSHRQDYERAGLAMFPLTWRDRDAVRVFLLLALFIYGASLALYGVGGFGLLYLIVANILGVILVSSSYHLLVSEVSQASWRVHKFSAYPYLGLIFLTLCLDLWI